MGKAFEGSLAHKTLMVVESIKNGGKSEIYRGELFQQVRKTYPKIHVNHNAIATIYERMKEYNIIRDSGATLGRFKIFTIIPKPIDIIPLWKARGDENKLAEARAQAAAFKKDTKKPDEDRQVADKDEIDAWELGEKWIRYVSILKQKLNEHDSMLRERSNELTKAKSAIKGLQREINIKEGKIKDLREGMKRHVSRSVHEEALQKIKRLEALVDELRQKPKRSGSKFPLSELATFK